MDHNGEHFLKNEKEMSAYYWKQASVFSYSKAFFFCFLKDETHSLLASGWEIHAYDQLLTTTHAFNILDSRGFVGGNKTCTLFWSHAQVRFPFLVYISLHWKLLR